MSNGARVNDVAAIVQFRAQLVKFVEIASVALVEAEGDVLRKMTWLEGEQSLYWTSQIRKWKEAVDKAKDAVRAKRIFKDALGRVQSVVDEEKHLKLCQAKLNYSEERLANTRRYARSLQRDHLLYRGGVQRFSTMISADMPSALSMLDGVVARLEAYFQSGPELVGSEAGPQQAMPSVKRAVDEPPPAEPGAEAKPADDKTEGA